MAVFGICEAGFNVGQAGKVEGHDQLWYHDVDLG